MQSSKHGSDPLRPGRPRHDDLVAEGTVSAPHSCGLPTMRKPAKRAGFQAPVERPSTASRRESTGTSPVPHALARERHGFEKLPTSRGKVAIARAGEVPRVVLSTPPAPSGPHDHCPA